LETIERAISVIRRKGEGIYGKSKSGPEVFPCGKEATRPEKYNTRSLMLISLVLGSCTTLFELLYFALVSSRSLVFVQTSMFLFLTLLQLIVIVSMQTSTHSHSLAERMRALLESHEVVDRLGYLGKTADGIIGQNCLRRRIALIGRDKNGFHPHLLGTEDIVV
jgi:zinc transporter ZupT